MFPDLSKEFFQDILKHNKTVSLKNAVFRDSKFFLPEISRITSFSEKEILRDHPHKETILKWLQGVQIEEFLNLYTKGSFQGIEVDSHYPAPQHFDNYVPEQFQQFMEENVQQWVNLGVLQKWDEVNSPGDPKVPLVVSPLGVESKKPRG